MNTSMTVEGRRRQVTVLFSDIVGFTPIAEALGEEASFRLVQKITAKMMEAVHAENGSVQEFRGDGIMALFGAPVALEDAPLRACRAALNMQRGLRALEDEIEDDFGVRPRIRIGIHTGPLVVGEVGDDQRMRFTAIGDTVNLAARLESEAGPGEVFFSAALHSLVEGQIEASLIGDRAIKGKSRPQRIYRLDGLRSGVSRFDVARHRGLTALVEREAELQRLETCLSRAAQGRIEIAHVVGEAGIGKSRLMHEFQTRLAGRDIVILQGDCLADGASSPFLPFVELVRSGFQIAKSDGPAQIESKLQQGLEQVGFEAGDAVPYLMALLGQGYETKAIAGLSADLIGARTRQLLLDLLWHRCRSRQVVLFIEDLHWIDPGSEQLLQRIADADEAVSLLLVCAFRPYYRPPWDGRANVTRIALERLSDAGTIKLLSERLGVQDLAAELVRLAVEKVEGNPLYAEEIARFLQERRGAQSGPDLGADDIVLPANLQNLVMDRFDRLDADARTALQAAAVAGRRFSGALVRDVTGIDAEPGALFAEAARQELVHRAAGTDSDYVFKHALVQDAILSTLMASQLRGLHAQLGVAIERGHSDHADDLADTLAYHFENSDLHDKAVHYLAMAGKKSLKLFSLDVADAYFTRAVALIDNEKLKTDRDFYADLLENWLEAKQWRADFGRTIEIFEQRMAEVEALRESDRYARIIALLGVAYSQCLRFDDAERLLSEALAIGEARRDDEAIAHGSLGLMGLHCHRTTARSYDDVRTLRDRVIALAERHGNLYFRTFANFYYSWNRAIHGDVDEAFRVGQDMVGLGIRRKYPGAVGFGSTALAYNATLSENFPDAIRYAEDGARTAGGPVDGLICLGIKGMAMALAGQGREGLALLQDVRRQLTEMRYFTLYNIVDMPIGLALATSGDLGAGVQWIEKSIAEASGAGNAHGAAMGQLVLGELYLQMASGAQKPTAAIVLRNLGFLLRTVPVVKSRALRHLDAAIAIGQASDLRGIQAAALLDKSILLRLRGRPAEARAALDEARAIAEGLDWQRIRDKIAAETANRT